MNETLPAPSDILDLGFDLNLNKNKKIKSERVLSSVDTSLFSSKQYVTVPKFLQSTRVRCGRFNGPTGTECE